VLKKKKKKNSAIDADGWTPLHAAVSSGTPEIVTLLLTQGADIRALTEEKESPMDVAEEEEIKEILRRT